MEPVSISEMGLRILAAFITGFVMGWERETHGRPAGLRTTTLACVASAVAMNVPQQPPPLVILMEGTLELEPIQWAANAPRRKLQWTLAHDETELVTGTVKCDEQDYDQENDSKKPAAKPSGDDEHNTALCHYQLFGRELLQDDNTTSTTNAVPTELLELKGRFSVSQRFHADKEPLTLVCDARWVVAKPLATLKPLAAAAAHKSDSHDNDNDDDDDLDADVDDELYHDELIALHEEACMSVDQLRKRLQQQQDDDAKKRTKPNAADEEDDFDGF